MRTRVSVDEDPMLLGGRWPPLFGKAPFMVQKRVFFVSPQMFSLLKEILRVPNY